MLHAEVDKNLWSEHSGSQPLSPILLQPGMVEKLMRNAWFLQQEIIGCKPWRMGILGNCLLIPSSPYCRKKKHAKQKIISFSRPVFLWNTNSNLGRFKEPGLQKTSSRCTAHRDSGEIVSFGPGGGSCAAQSNPIIVHWHVATEVWKLLAAITVFLCFRGGGSSFSKLIRLPKGSFVCQKKQLQLVKHFPSHSTLLSCTSSTSWLWFKITLNHEMRSYPRNIWVMVSNSY